MAYYSWYKHCWYIFFKSFPLNARFYILLQQLAQSVLCFINLVTFLVLFFFFSQVFQSLEDHHLEVVSFFRENGFHGLIAHDSEYALCNIPSYYSSHALKLSWNGKNLTTNQFLMQEVAKQLGLKMSNFPIFAALLGKVTASQWYSTRMKNLYLQLHFSLSSGNACRLQPPIQRLQSWLPSAGHGVTQVERLGGGQWSQILLLCRVVLQWLPLGLGLALPLSGIFRGTIIQFIEKPHWTNVD